jgi:hypothetical protein
MAASMAGMKATASWSSSFELHPVLWTVHKRWTRIIKCHHKVNITVKQLHFKEKVCMQSLEWELEEIGTICAQKCEVQFLINKTQFPNMDTWRRKHGKVSVEEDVIGEKTI